MNVLESYFHRGKIHRTEFRILTSCSSVVFVHIAAAPGTPSGAVSSGPIKAGLPFPFPGNHHPTSGLLEFDCSRGLT